MFKNVFNQYQLHYADSMCPCLFFASLFRQKLLSVQTLHPNLFVSIPSHFSSGYLMSSASKHLWLPALRAAYLLVQTLLVFPFILLTFCSTWHSLKPLVWFLFALGWPLFVHSFASNPNMYFHFKLSQGRHSTILHLQFWFKLRFSDL